MRTDKTLPNYAAVCRQTVTLYNKTPGRDEFHKTVFNASAFLESRKVFQEGRTGVTAANPALLVIPQGADGQLYADPGLFDAMGDKTGFFTLRHGDKAVPGIGRDVATLTDWTALNKLPGTVTVTAADVKRGLDGEVAHIEGGGN
ncbi:MAG: hypothetical protein LBR76_01710 [Oscillospiraceae bacterium]|jgi:hypothetical protein|nr:hypothetical protein [Oscillospiraceae bacterium]